MELASRGLVTRAAPAQNIDREKSLMKDVMKPISAGPL